MHHYDYVMQSVRPIRAYLTVPLKNDRRPPRPEKRTVKQTNAQYRVAQKMLGDIEFDSQDSPEKMKET